MLVPGKAEESDLYLAITWKDQDLQMPPKENDRLTGEQTWFVRDRIKGGTRWVACPDPQIIFQYYDGRTGRLAYAQAVSNGK